MTSMLMKVFMVAALVQAFYYLYFFARLNFYRRRFYEADDLPAVSVLVCARNEAANLSALLKLLLIQQYPKYEVIVVNDQSTDATAAVLAEYAHRNPHLKIVNIPTDLAKPWPGKKYPLALGVENAQHEIIVTTDADCRPAGVQWLRHMVSCFYGGVDFVLGYSPVQKQNGLLCLMQRYDNLMTATQYLSYAMAGIPYMGVGRNLAFRKHVFDENIYARSRNTAGGDDDLLVNAKANALNTAVCLSPESIVTTPAQTTWSGWLNQKIRHSRAAVHYKPFHLLLLWLFMFSKWLFYVGFIALLLMDASVAQVSVVFAVAWFGMWMCTFRLFIRWGEWLLLLALPLFDFFYVCFIAIQPLMLILKRQDRWK